MVILMKPLKLFQQMKLAVIKPNRTNYETATVLQVCSNIAILQLGKEVHLDIIAGGFSFELKVENAIMHIYAKCGSIEDARMVFLTKCVNFM